MPLPFLNGVNLVWHWQADQYWHEDITSSVNAIVAHQPVCIASVDAELRGANAKIGFPYNPSY